MDHGSYQFDRRESLVKTGKKEKKKVIPLSVLRLNENYN